MAEMELAIGTKYNSKIVAFGNGLGIYLPVDVCRWANLEEGTEIVMVFEESKKYGRYIGIGKKKA